MPNLVAIDLGTSRIKCALFDEKGIMSHLRSRRLARAASPNLQDALVWSATTDELLRELNAESGIQADAVVLTGNMHALLGVDEDGVPLAPAILWSDNSSTEESDFLNLHYGDALYDKFGNCSIPVFTLPKLLRMKKQSPGLYARISKFLQSKDFVSHSLTGHFVTDPTDASGTLLMELANSSWSEEILDDLELDSEKLPDILPSASFCGKVTADAARRTGLREGTPVVTGLGDLSSAALGGGVNDETLSLTLGTAGQLLGSGEHGAGRKLAGKLFVFSHADPERELYLGSVPSGGFSFEWLARIHHLSVDDFFRQAEKAPFNESLPIFLPYLLGRGAPYMDYEPNGAWLHLKASHTLADLCLGAIFGTLCPLRQCTDMLEALTGPRPNLMLQALASREKPVRECAGRLFTQQKFLPENSEASLLGAAVVGMTALGVYSSISEAGKNMVRGQAAEPSGLNATAARLYASFREQKVVS